MSMLRKYKRDIIRHEIGSNDIKERFHREYGYRPIVTEQTKKSFLRWFKKKRKQAHLKARLKRRGAENVGA